MKKKADHGQVKPVVICSDIFFDACINALHDVRRIAIEALKERGFDANSVIVEINEAVISNTAKLTKLSGKGLSNTTGIFNR